VVYRCQREYSPSFVFWQLMSWFGDGGPPPPPPSLAGCGQLPTPAMCFGNAAHYTKKEQTSLVELLASETTQCLPWPAPLRRCFAEDLVPEAGGGVLGSPMLDIALGQVSALDEVLAELRGGASGRGKMPAAEGREQQLDEQLAPEQPTDWVQCETCLKWRRLPWHVDVESLEAPWECSFATWEGGEASCDRPQDAYDPSREGTLEYKAHLQHDLAIGDELDVFCLTNEVFYEARVVDVCYGPPPKRKGRKGAKAGLAAEGQAPAAQHADQQARGVQQQQQQQPVAAAAAQQSGAKHVRCHFKGWGSRWDEWLPAASPRLQPHGLRTLPGVTAAAQERYQKEQRSPPPPQLLELLRGEEEEALAARPPGKARGKAQQQQQQQQPQQRKEQPSQPPPRPPQQQQEKQTGAQDEPRAPQDRKQKRRPASAGEREAARSPAGPSPTGLAKRARKAPPTPTRYEDEFVATDSRELRAMQNAKAHGRRRGRHSSL